MCCFVERWAFDRVGEDHSHDASKGCSAWLACLGCRLKLTSAVVVLRFGCALLQVLLNLGLGGPCIDPKPTPTAAPRRPPRKRPAPAATEGAGAAPVRRSARTRGALAAGASEVREWAA